MANLEFKTDLKLGNEGEETLIKFLESKGCIYVDSNNDNKYDLKMVTHGKETTYEIKTDVLVAPVYDTGNIFIEFSSRDKDSGIRVTQADWFVTYLKYLKEIWFIKSEDLKKIILENDFPIFYDAGDIGSKTHGYLIKRLHFKKYFHVCKI